MFSIPEDSQLQSLGQELGPCWESPVAKHCDFLWDRMVAGGTEIGVQAQCLPKVPTALVVPDLTQVIWLHHLEQFLC